MDITVWQNLLGNPWLVYPLIFLCMFLDANLTIIFSVFLVTQGQLNIFSSFAALVSGAFAEQYAYYWLGGALTKSDVLTRKINQLTDRYDAHFFERTFHSLLISKFIYGLHRAVLMRCGMLKLGLQKFTRATLKSTTIWLAIMIILGLLFGASYDRLKSLLRYGELALLAVLIIFLAAEYFLSKKLKKDL